MEAEETMGISLEALESMVLQLRTADRVRLLDRVVASLDADAAREAALEEVAANRERQLEEDPSLLVPMDEVLDRLREELK